MNFTFQDFLNCVQNIQDTIIEEGIERINWGGCGVFAVALIERMLNAGIPKDEISLVVYGYNGNRINLNDVETELDEHKINKYDLHTWNDAGVNFGHVMVGWNDHVFDCEMSPDSIENNQTWEYGYSMYSGSIGLEVMRELAYNGTDWNTVFDRTQIPKIENIIDRCFADLLQ